MKSQNTLAVVLPAYKPEFLGQALKSLSDQSIKDFDVVVADDCSPHDLESIVRRYQADLSIRYHRFDSNMGGYSLADQWTRSVRLTSAPWVWLFSDDDQADGNCVEVLLAALADPSVPPTRLFHFNTRIIDGEGRLIREAAAFPARLRAQAFVQARMDMRFSSFACEYVFSREAFEEVGGFVDFPAAWCSDDASWVALAGDSEIVTLGTAKVNWRRSGINISSPGSSLGSAKVDAMVAYLEWLAARNMTVTSGSSGNWFRSVLREQGQVVGTLRHMRAARAIHRLDGSWWPICYLSLVSNDVLAVARRHKPA